MLDTDTKRRIDTARDILVGKVPDPKSQVEQITIALIYKFMDDMDKEVEELGGKHTFFKGEFAKYSWSRIFDPRISGYELVTLYGEAIDKMNLNPNIPQLFRDIFKNAYLPYRDPETLKSFLKIINEFHYNHSEKLGDAYEYLLSVLGSQGDAGQFRTPRHIIDFIVEVVSPQKTDKILDPACGTAGFLISSYKQILKDNTKKRLGDTLKPEERNNIIKNFCGYDISPDMIRMSLVNMYLHGFENPKIYEYDTLTSEERWNEYYDVILANPPFMSPKGGIKPHKRFSLQANRSEVLFVDYICEHLTPSGRAGIIVPEGIIFQSGNAYKQLRKMLVENYLWAVISLPAGVFNPYSGVKTSILLIDKQLNKKSNKILFVKIDNDGFGLGAQRREIEKNDLTESTNLLKQYKEAFLSNMTFSFENNNLLLVEKDNIANKDDYNLSIDRYRVSRNIQRGSYEMVKLIDIVEILDYKRKPITKSDRKPGPYPYYGATGIVDSVYDFIFDERLVLVGEDGAKWDSGEKTAFIAEGKYWVNNHAHVLRAKCEILIDTYLVEILNLMDLNEFITGVTVPKLNQEKLREIEIPLPPLSVQQEIVNKIDNFQSIINGARQVVDNYKPQIDISSNCKMVYLYELMEKINDNINPQELSGIVKYIGLENIESNSGMLIGNVETNYSEIKSTKTRFKKGDILYGKLRPNLNKVLYATFDGICSTDIFVLRAKKDVAIGKLYSEYLRTQNFNTQVLLGIKGSQLPRVGYDYFSEIKVPIPPLEEQQQIVSRIESEQKLIDANKELIKLYEQKIKDEIEKVWVNKE